MGGAVETAKREDLIQRVSFVDPAILERGSDVPLDWDDLRLLCQGLALASRPLHAATRSLTEQHSLGPRGAWTLNLIAGGIIYPNELSDLFMIGRSLVSAELSRLTEAGLIESQPGETDRRRTILTLTDKGRDVLDQMNLSIEDRLSGLLAHYTPEQVRLFAGMLGHLRAGISANEDRCD